MVETGRTTFEEACDEHYAAFACQLAVKIGARTWNRFGEVEVVGVFDLTEIERVVQLLENDEFRTLSGSATDVIGQILHVLFDIGGLGLLDKSDFHIIK